jgi:hypothetical protein
VGVWAPPLTLRETRLGCRLTLGGLGHGSGTTLPEAADELVLRVVAAALAMHAGDLTFTPGLLPEPRSVEFLREVAEVAAHGGDVRRLVLGGERTRAA